MQIKLSERETCWKFEDGMLEDGSKCSPCDPSGQEVLAFLEILWLPEIWSQCERSSASRVTAGVQLSSMTHKILLMSLEIPFLHCFLVCLVLPEWGHLKMTKCIKNGKQQILDATLNTGCCWIALCIIVWNYPIRKNHDWSIIYIND